MRYVVIEGSGPVGTYLIPQPVRLGHEVVSISRSHREPYRDGPAWTQVERIAAKRSAEGADGSLGRRVRESLESLAARGSVAIPPFA